MPRVAALCGSRRTGSYNRMLLNTLIERSPEGLEVVDVDITAFPVYNQDLEKAAPQAVLDAKELIQSCDCVLLVSPEYNFGVPGYLKSAVDWLSRPYGDPTLVGRPMAVCGAALGYMGTSRGQLHWRQSWHFFKAPVFSEVELTVAFAPQAFDESGTMVDETQLKNVDNFLGSLNAWLERGCAPR